MKGRNERYRDIKGFALRSARAEPESESWWCVRALIPDAWFAKRGPGVLADAKTAWRKMTDGQRTVAVANGWFLASGPK